jgi:hypothetical protein
MPTLDPGDLTDLIRDCAIDLWQSGVSSSTLFVNAFNQKFGDRISTEQRQYGFDQWLAAAGKKMMKKVGKELERLQQTLQYDLPMDLRKYDIPDTLTMPNRWVPLHLAEEIDLDAYLDELQKNADDCLNKIIGFTTFAERVRPVLRANPGWKVGDALRWLCAQDRAAA